MITVINEKTSDRNSEAFPNSEVVEHETESENNIMLTEKIITENGNKVNNKSSEYVLLTPVASDTSSYGPSNPIPSGTTPQDLGFIKIRKEQIAEYEKVFAPLRYELVGLLHVAGYNVLPCNDGEKYPYVSWREYQNKRVTTDEQKFWINKKPKAMWISCGSISGNFQPPDFDQTSEGKRLFNEFVEAAQHLIEKYNLHFTNSGSAGKHCFLRVDSQTEYAGDALAFLPDPALDKVDKNGELEKGYKCVTEIRGEGQGIMMPFSLYKFKRPEEFKDDPNYEDWYGYYWTPLTPQEFVDSIALISEVDFLELKTIIKKTGVEVPQKKVKTNPPKDQSGKVVIPGSSDDMIGHFNKNNSIVDILNYYSGKLSTKEQTKYSYLRHGRGNTLHYAYTPPSGKGSIVVDVEKNTSWHFSSSDPLYTDSADNPNRIPQTPFNIYCVFEHKGDVTAAVAELYRQAELAAAEERMKKLTEKLEEAKTKKDVEELKKELEDLQYQFNKMAGNGEPETPPVDEPEGEESEPKKEKRHPLEGDDLDELDDIPPIPWLVEGLFSRQEVGVLYGDASVGKTFASIDLAMAAITGGRFANRFQVVEPIKVIYFAGEGKSRIQERIIVARDHYKISKELRKNLKLVKNVPLFSNEDPSFSTRAVVELYKDFNPGLIIIDTLDTATQGLGENDTDDMRDVLVAGSNLAEQLNCVVLFIHHENKQGGMRGSIVIKTKSNFIFHLTRQGESDTRTLSCKKLKDGDEWAKVNFELVKPEFETPSVVVKWEENKEKSPFDKEQSGDELSKDELDKITDYKIVTYLTKYPDEWFTTKQIHEVTGIPQSTVYRRIPKLVSEQRIDQNIKKNVSNTKSTAAVYKYHKIEF